MHLDALLSLPLFEGIDTQQLPSLLTEFMAVDRQFARGAYLLHAGAPPQFGLIVSGQAHVIKEDFWGHRSLLARLSSGDLFGESFVLSGHTSLPVSVVAQEPVLALFLQPSTLLSPSGTPCASHMQVLGNLLRILAEKNRLLTQKMEHVTKRTLRSKLLSYLSEQARISGSAQFTIPFNRQQLSDYLAVDRSALSAELSRMQRDGLLSYHKNKFSLYVQQT